MPRLGSRVRAPLSAPSHDSGRLEDRPFSYPAKWPSGKAEACKAFTPGSNPGFASSAFKGSERAPFPCPSPPRAARVRTALAARAYRSPTCDQKSVESGFRATGTSKSIPRAPSLPHPRGSTHQNRRIAILEKCPLATGAKEHLTAFHIYRCNLLMRIC